METETTNKQQVRKYGLITLIIIIGVLLIYYAVMAMIAPAKKYNGLKDEYGYKQVVKNSINDTIQTDSTYLALFREKAFLQARTSIAETDSIYLSINLVDSSMVLEISGVAVARTKLTRISLSKMFLDRNDYVISSMLSKPFTIERNIASIPKEPLMIKMAPKDTSEFKPDIIPDTADYEPVNYILEMNNGTVMHVYQEEKLNRGDRSHLFLFDLRYRLRSAWSTLKSVFTFKVPEYHPYIKVRLPRSDAKIIYRALPGHGQIAVYR
ncbi:MAG: hypothetical protein NT092_02945 [Bacteroidia bacterium]|nr:hypothetical protein [Bacteroidia bacterium]